ncbi:hypothetical protein E3N88_34704 [Mikania micrantha]|uniref:Transmembrane protein n=1 Tax=Mikania micrantha TaxID=192012 RepID=A0A5N6LYX4_9ASTR|nr:hypothetical protein E3N88_34704 [Mikania micrantha]
MLAMDCFNHLWVGLLISILKRRLGYGYMDWALMLLSGVKKKWIGLNTKELGWNRLGQASKFKKNSGLGNGLKYHRGGHRRYHMIDLELRTLIFNNGMCFDNAARIHVYTVVCLGFGLRSRKMFIFEFHWEPILVIFGIVMFFLDDCIIKVHKFLRKSWKKQGLQCSGTYLIQEWRS